MRASAMGRLSLILLAGGLLLSIVGAEPESGRARIALFQPAGQEGDAALTAVLATVADSVELSLAVLQRYDVKRLPSADPVKDLARVRAYCQANRIDQAILGSGSARAQGGYLFKLVLYDRRTDAITLAPEGSSTGALDMFDVTDTLVSTLLDGMSGTHLVFGSLSVETDPAGATVTVNGKEVGAAPLSLRGLPVGTVQVVAHAAGHDDANVSVTIVDGESTDAPLNLARSTGTLTVIVPKDAVVAVRSAEIGRKEITGGGGTVLPTGDYDVQASSNGLPGVSGQVTIARGAGTQWLPWPKGYLDVQAVPAGATVVVDGVEKGIAPLVVEVEPRLPHRVELRLDKYEPFRTEVSAAVGDKTSLTPALVGLPGSISVDTSIPGAEVDLDDSVQKANTPALFKAVSAGIHILKFGTMQVGDRLYTVGDPIQVVVKPGEPTAVSKTFVQGVAHLTIPDAPAGSDFEIGGSKVDPAQAISSGVDVLAGTVNVVIKGPNNQKWVGSTSLDVGQNLKQSIYTMTWHIPERTVAMDGSAGDWAGLLPVWIPDQQLAFANQPGTSIARGFACHDDKFLYFRYEFANGTPQPPLTKEIREELDYTQILWTDKGQVTAITKFRRGLFGKFSTSTTLGIEDPITHAWRGLAENTVKYRIGDSSLEVAVPLAPIKSYLQAASRSGGFIEGGMRVVDVRSSGGFQSYVDTGKQMVDFGF